MSNGSPITSGMIFEAIQQGAREATLEMLKNVDFSTSAGQEQAKAVLDAISGKVATNETLQQVLLKLTNDPATATNQTQIKSLVEALSNKDFATQGTLAQILTKLADPATQTTLLQVLQKLQGTLDVSGEVSLPESQKVDISNRADRDLGKVTLSGQIPVIWGKDISDRPPADEVPVGTQFIVANENLDAWVSNETDWVVI